MWKAGTHDYWLLEVTIGVEVNVASSGVESSSARLGRGTLDPYSTLDSAEGGGPKPEIKDRWPCSSGFSGSQRAVMYPNRGLT
jgi:hypothetical protein